MKFQRLRCFDTFRCLAGQCPSTCCAGWEIDLDEESLSRYQKIPGAFGDTLRKHIHTEGRFTFFGLNDGRCPFLNAENLCQLILTLGEDALSQTCREHPRFVEEYGDLQETCLSISCPEAARLLLTGDVTISAETAPGTPTGDYLPEEDLLTLLLEFREDLMACAHAPAPLSRRLETVEGTAETMQTALNELLPFDPPVADRLPRPALSQLLRHMTQLEFTGHRLPRLLETGDDTLLNTPLSPAQEEAGERLLVYFLYRYLLRGVWDGRLLEKVLFCTYSVRVILYLASLLGGTVADAAVCYSREVEHSDENLDSLYSFFAEKSV